MKLKKILNILNDIAPFDIAETWDNSGLQAGSPVWDVTKVMVGLDVTMPLLLAAKKSKSDLVLTHHPLMMTPEKSFDFEKMPGSAIRLAAREKINIVSLHTNLDKANNGLNDYFASRIGIQETASFLQGPPEPGPEESLLDGIGRMGGLKKAQPASDLAQQIKEQLGLSSLRVTGDMTRPVKIVAVCTGSGGSLVDAFIRSTADVFVTGDIKYHEARAVEEAGKILMDVGHFASEHMAIDLIEKRLAQAFQTACVNMEIIKYLTEKDPFTIV